MSLKVGLLLIGIFGCGSGFSFPSDSQTAGPGSNTSSASQPIVTTGTASDIRQTIAMLQGSITPDGVEAYGWFEWGTTTAYGGRTEEQPLGDGSDAVPFSAALSGLTPGVTYHYRAVGRSEAKTPGEDRTFVTWPESRIVLATQPALNSLAAVGLDVPAMLGSIPVANTPLRLAVTPDRSEAWVIGHEATVILRLDNLSVTGSAPMTGDFIEFSPDGTRAYGINMGGSVTSTTVPITLTVMDTASRTVIVQKTSSGSDASFCSTGVDPGPLAGGGCIITGMAVTPDGQRLYLTTHGGIKTGANPAQRVWSDEVVAVDAATLATLSKIAVNEFNTFDATTIYGPLMQIPWGIVISPDGTKAYVGLNECYDDYYVTGSAGDDGASSEVGRLDLATGTWDPAKTGFPSQWNWDPGMFLVLRDSINNLEPFIHDIAISPAGDRVFVSTGKIPYLHNVKYVDAGNLNTGYNSLQIFYPDLDQYTGSVITMGGMDAWGLAATPDGASLLIGLQAGSATNTVSAYDPAEDLFGLVSVLGVTTLTNTGNITVPDAFDVGITFP